jgi:hypothetical protein
MAKSDKQIQLGWRVKDVVTDFEGIAVTRLESLDGGIEIGVRAKAGSKEGRNSVIEYISEVQLQKIDDGITVSPQERTFGFRADR